MKKFFKEFGAFISRGNILDLAIGVIMGGTFGKIITSLVKDLLMPLIGLLIGGNFAEMNVVLVEAVMDGTVVVTPATTLNYGAFIQTIIDFLIIALVIFIIVRAVMKAHQLADKIKADRQKAEEQAAVVAAPAVPKPTTEELLMEIRDLLAKPKTKE
ncbi:MAG TPA: large conductance mechanosensitive channel protein MscL [Acholeplasmatales bacterium]|nr:large conductance mechanosensitive channel protein MscL [Acholeplasmatales bacterium]